MPIRPEKPAADFPLFPHAGGTWAKSSDVRNVRILFKFGVDERLIKELPNYGQSMKQPSKKQRRIHHQEQRKTHGKKLFTREELKTGKAGGSI